jgi:hypothetical protein
VRHIPDGVLRRLDDEPLAVPDRVTDHVAGCERCSARRAEIARDTERAVALLAPPQSVSNTDLAWKRLRRELEAQPAHGADPRRQWARRPMRHSHFPRLSLRTGLAIGLLGALVAGTAAAATLTTIFAPTHVAPVSVSQGDLQAFAAIAGLGPGEAVGGFSTPSGSHAFRFGTITWSSGSAHPASSRAQAAAEVGFAFELPARLPAGVGAVERFGVQPHGTATVNFGSAAGSLAGSSVTLDAGPAVVAQYGGKDDAPLPTLAVAVMRRPTARATRATIGQIEAFVLSRPGIPPALAEEVRLLGDLRTILPVPVPPGASVRSVQVGGWPALLLGDSSNAASAVVWEDGHGLLHAVVGVLDPRDVLNVARQIG